MKAEFDKNSVSAADSVTAKFESDLTEVKSGSLEDHWVELYKTVTLKAGWRRKVLKRKIVDIVLPGVEAKQKSSGPEF